MRTKQCLLYCTSDWILHSLSGIRQVCGVNSCAMELHAPVAVARSPQEKSTAGANNLTQYRQDRYHCQKNKGAQTDTL